MSGSERPFLSPDRHAFTLPDAEVHIWQASLDLEPAELRHLSGFLSQDERDRAEGFHFARDQQRYITAHGILRDILARYLAIRADRLRFSYGPYGKPMIDHQASRLQTALEFNLSRSEHRAIYAIACGRAVGVDIQYIKPDVEVLEIAAACFSSREHAALVALPRSLQRDTFYRWWSRKEAYLKARGVGLAFGMDSTGLMLEPGVQLLRDPSDNTAAVLPWYIEDLAIHPDYTAALAATGKENAVRFLRWEGQL